MIGDEINYGIERNNYRRHDAQFPVVSKHQRKSQDDDKYINRKAHHHVVDKGSYLNGIIDPGDDLSHPHGVKKVLGQFEQVFVVSENKLGIDELPCLQRENTFANTNEYLRHQQHNHHNAHHVQEISITVEQDIVDNFLQIDRAGKSDDSIDQSAEERLNHD